jgi:hypothetical protein
MRLINLSAIFAIGLIWLLTSGCNARQSTAVGPEQSSQLAQQVKVYQPGEIAGMKYTSLGSIDASACKWMLWDETPTQQGVANQLLLKARAMNANGITNLSCESGNGAALVRDCWSRVACTAEAIQVRSNP